MHFNFIKNFLLMYAVVIYRDISDSGHTCNILAIQSGLTTTVDFGADQTSKQTPYNLAFSPNHSVRSKQQSEAWQVF